MSLINLIDFDSAQIFDENGRDVEVIRISHDDEKIDAFIQFPIVLDIGDGNVDVTIEARIEIDATKLFLNDLKISAYDLKIDEKFEFRIFCDSVIGEEKAYQFIEAGLANDLIFDNRFRFEANVNQ